MRAVVQRVSHAHVLVGSERVAQIGAGLVVLVGVAQGDGETETDRLATKVARLRIFEGEDGKLDQSVREIGGEVLAVSQFTLIADSRRQKGTRPDFSGAARRDVAQPLYERFCEALRDHGLHVETGVFGARMQVELVNDGPVTIIIET
jgi:D-tyrosyl-tRNA(Tyr) deacylase